MNLTEGQLFTIEALNRIEWFAWPKDANFACAFNFVNGRNFSVEFYIEKPTPSNAIEAFKGALSKGNPTKVILGQHPDWRNSLITREQFDSVDGWVRVTDSGHVIKAKTGWELNDCGDKWRYHKPTKENEVQPETPNRPSIDELYSQYKTQRGIVESAKKTLAYEMEAEDKLLEQIKAWNLEHGFDVRLLDESEEKPELVITDWRDLRAGDIVTYDDGAIKEIIGMECEVALFDEGHPTQQVGVSIQTDEASHFGWPTKWTFIRRP